MTSDGISDGISYYTRYTVTDKDDKIVFAQGCFHVYDEQCPNSLKEKLEALPNPQNLTIIGNWSCEEEDNFSEPMNLADFLAGNELVYPSLMNPERLYEEKKELQAKLLELQTKLDRLEKELKDKEEAASAWTRMTKAMMDGWEFVSFLLDPGNPFHKDTKEPFYSMYSSYRDPRTHTRHRITAGDMPATKALSTLMDMAGVPDFTNPTDPTNPSEPYEHYEGQTGESL